MATKQFQITLPEELLERVGLSEGDLPAQVAESFVMDLLRLDKLTEAEAASALGLNRWELLDAMGRHEVAAIQLSPDELAWEMLDAVDEKSAERLAELARLDYDWDKYAGMPPTVSARNFASMVLMTFAKADVNGTLGAPFIAPLPNGGLQIEWSISTPAQCGLTVEVPAEGRSIDYLLEFQRDGVDVEEEGTIPGDASVRDIVGRLARSAQPIVP